MIGQPAAGKSAVIARAALALEADRIGPGLAFHARSATITDFITAIRSISGADRARTTDQLIDQLADVSHDPPIQVVVDALDEAATETDRRRIADALAELAVLPGMRVAVATRVLAAGDPFAWGGILASLGVRDRVELALINLDADEYADPDGLRDFAAALLSQDSATHPAPPGGAWKGYRANTTQRDRLATVIAERAEHNFLVAAMAAAPLSTASNLVDPAAKDFDPTAIPTGIGEALTKHLERLPERRRERERALLTALAYTRGSGIDDYRWLTFAAKLGYDDTSVTDLDALRYSPAADYLLQTTTEADKPPVTRLFHQALIDELRTGRHQLSDETKLFDALLEAVSRTGWHTDDYARSHTAEHANAADRLDHLLDDTTYLLAVEPHRLLPHLDAVRTTPGRTTASTYRQTAHTLPPSDPPTRASQLELAAHRLGYHDLAARIATTAAHRAWHTQWSHGHAITDHQSLTGHRGPVYAVAVGALPDGTPVIISGSGGSRGAEAGEVRVWRLADGTPIGNPLHFPKPVRALGAVNNLVITASDVDLAMHRVMLLRATRG